jgi:hypothetical protein
LNHDLTDDLLLTAKVSYDTRDFHQGGDNDQAYTTTPLLGSALWSSRCCTCRRLFMFWWRKTVFCENVDSERTYDFSDVNQHGTQLELNIISSFDGPFNYTAGIYQIEDMNDNVYIAQTAGSQFLGSFGYHPYSALVKALTAVDGVFPGYDWSSKGGVGFYSGMLTWVGLLAQGSYFRSICCSNCTYE